MAQTNDEVVEELTSNELFMDTFRFMATKFPDVAPESIGEILIVGVLFDRGLITRGDNE
jgi:hypothetical protein